MSESTEISETTSIQLGDIIEIIAPTDPALNNHTFYIKFLDKSKIVLVEASGIEQTLTLSDGGKLDNEAITDINILSHAESPSYALQNNLITGKWIDMYFGGDVPTIITGEITNLEEDMIEITTYPERDVIYIDFAYKGIPEDIPIIKINLRKQPTGTDTEGLGAEGADAEASTEALKTPKKTAFVTSLETLYEGEGEGEDKDQGEGEVRPPPEKIAAQIRELFISADQIHFGEELEAVTEVVNLPESEQRYSLEKQTTDLLDEMLSRIPNIKRTDIVLNNIHTMIERFKQLRRKFSIFDKDGNLIKSKFLGENYNPLVESLKTFNQKLYWLLPVVKNMKKVYNYEDSPEDYSDIISLTFADARSDQEEVVDQYNDGNMPDQDNKYAFLLRSLNPYFTPFENGTTDEMELARIKVNANIAAIVDNLGDFYSSVMSVNKDLTSIDRRRFVIQEYNLGVSGLDVSKVRGGDMIINRKQITENDTLVLKSLLFLPEVTVKFSRVNLPYTNILMKSNLSAHFINYWQFLKNNTDVKTIVVENFEEPVDYESNKFLKKIMDMKLDESLLEASLAESSLAESSSAAASDVYDKYLDAVVPKTQILFNLIKPYINDNLTLHDVITYMEPFMIYQDDITATQYKEMGTYITQKIIDKKKEYVLKNREFNSLKASVSAFKPKLVALFETNSALREAVMGAYGLTDSNLANMPSEEFILKINSIDCGILYNTAIAMIGSNLMIANGLKDINDISKYIKNAPQQKAANTNKAPQCNTYTEISKRYIALDELEEDNGKDIYFDKKYDTTHYDLLIDYKKPEPNMENEAYIGFLINNLMKKIGLNESNARREAIAMLEGRRIVEDGDYAILEQGTETGTGLDMQYYRRQNNSWLKDEDISPDVFDDKLKMICNLDAKCLEVKNNCDTLENGGIDIKEANLKLVLKEFDEQLNINKAVVVKHINDDFTDALKRMGTLLDLIHNNTYKNNYNQYNLGISLEETDTVASPYLKLRDIILGQADYVKRQQDIIKFVNTFTREPLETEDQYWLYCIKTNTKLIPSFLPVIAKAFVLHEDFIYTVEKICKEQGKLSDDGDSWVDAYSGYIIRKISLNTDDEFTEEGYKNITRAVLEADLGESILQQKKTQKHFIDPETEKISNVITTLTNFMGINMDSYKEFIIRNVRKLLETKMLSEDSYNKQLAIAATKGKKNLDDYQTAYSQFLMYSTLSYLFIAVQASIPSIRTRKTHPGCVRSFTGFPMGSTEDKTGITYLACIVNKVKSPIEHWKSIQKMNIATIVTRIEMQITKFILPTEEVQELIKLKQHYLLLNVDETIPDVHNISNMIQFLPPLIPIKMKTIQNVSEAFNKELLEALRAGSIKQDTMINVIRGKIIYYAFGINELVQKTVHKKAAIMTNNAGEPFLENACCDASGKISTIQYFIEAQPDIALYNARIVDLANTIQHIIRMGKAGIFFDPRDTKNIIPPLLKEFSEETIYKAFIVFCKYGSNLPISEELKAICMNKPEDFNDKSSLAEQMRKLKSEGRNYSQETFQQLLTIVNKNNIIANSRHSLIINTVQALKDILLSLEQRNVVNLPLAFTEKFQNVLATFEINGLVEDTAEMRALQNYLGAANDSMVASINSFIQKSAVINDTDFKKFKECIDNISEFQETGVNMVMDAKDETVFKMMNFIKNSLRCLTREFPNIIINEVDNASIKIPKHWGLSERHTADIRDIINKHYVSLYEFYKDTDISNILQKFMRVTRDTEILASLTEFYAPLKMSEDKYIYSTMERRLVVRLFKFYFYSTLIDLISLKDDDDILLRRVSKPSSTEEEDDDDLMSTTHAYDAQNGDITELEIIRGEKKDIAEKIAKLLHAFMGIICQDKKVINYNYKNMMDKVLRSKEKEKDDITSRLKHMTDEEREVETIFKNQQLERWSKGLQKGLVSYQKGTYDEERESMEKQMLVDQRLAKNKDISDMNKEMYQFDLLVEDQDAAEIEDEEMRIVYMGEDADPEEFGMDGDEEFD
jgi:hypothetical protein